MIKTLACVDITEKYDRNTKFELDGRLDESTR